VTVEATDCAHARRYMPGGWLNWALVYHFWGAQPLAFHLESVLLHAANGVLLFLLWARLAGSFWRSALVAGLFVLHPLHVESVAWVSERKDVLVGDSCKLGRGDL